MFKGNSMTRDQIIEVFLVRAIPGERYQLRQKLEQMTTEELATAYTALQSQVQLQAQEQKLLEIQAEADVERALHEQRMFTAYESHDRETFKQAARVLRFGELLALIEPRIAQSEYKFTIQNYIRTSSTYQHLRDRIELCQAIADNHSPDQRVNNQEFCLLLLAKNDNETYREKVTNIREVQKFKMMSPLEIKTYLAKKRTEQQPSHEERVAAEIIAPEDQRLLEAANNDPRPPLPERTSRGEEIDAVYLNRLQATDYSSYRELLQRHGRIRLEARIRGVK